MAAENSANLARIPPPPPFKPSSLPPPPSPDGHTTIIVIVFISIGSCLFFFTFIAAAVCCFIKKRKQSCPQPQEVVEAIRIDGHRKVHEDVAEGGHGQQAVMVTIEDDVHIDEIVKKKEHGHAHTHGLHGKKHEGGSHNTNNSTTREVAASSSTTS